MLALESKIQIRTTPRLYAFYYQTKLPIYLFFLLKCLQLPVDYNLFHENDEPAVNFRKNWKNVILAILERSGARYGALWNL